MVYHVLNGDVLAEQLDDTCIKGDRIVCRECLIVGDLSGDTHEAFWKTRAKFISVEYGATEQEYFDKTVSGFKKILDTIETDEINLWFEDDLFCQANMWYILHLISEKSRIPAVYRIFPVIRSTDDTWKGFSGSDPHMLNEAFASRVRFSLQDIQLGSALWNAYKCNDFVQLIELSESKSECFRSIKEVCQAHKDRFPEQGAGRPEQTVIEIIKDGKRDFSFVLSEFTRREGIYGFGDLQLKPLYEKVTRKNT